MSLLMLRAAILSQGAPGAGSGPPAVLEVRISALRSTTILTKKGVRTSALRCTAVLTKKGVWTSALRCTVILKET